MIGRRNRGEDPAREHFFRLVAEEMGRLGEPYLADELEQDETDDLFDAGHIPETAAYLLVDEHRGRR